MNVETFDLWFGRAIAAYILVGIITFGHAFNHPPEVCLNNHPDKIGCKVFGALAPSLVWPLYVSAQIWGEMESE